MSEATAIAEPVRELAQLRPLRGAVDYDALVSAAAADDHIVIAPTHVMARGPQIIGYLSLAGMPVVQAWFDSKQCSALNSVRLIQAGETIFARHGVKEYCVGVAAHSPFAPNMERLGFRRLLTNTLWQKTI